MNSQNKAEQSPRGVRIGPLLTPGNVKVEAARLYKAARRGEVASADASRLASVLALILKVIEGADLEARIEALERAQRPHAAPRRAA